MSKDEVKRVEKPSDELGGLRERAVLARLSIGCWTGSGKDEQIVEKLRQEAGGNGKVGTFTKKYMSRDYIPFSNIHTVINVARAYHKKMTLPWGDAGVRVLPASVFLEYKKQMTTYERDFAVAVDLFFAGYNEAVEIQRERLGKMWDARDYPTEEQLRRKFRLQCVVEPIPTADDFRLKLSKERAQEIRQDYEEEVKDRMRGAVLEVYANIREVVETLKDKVDDPSNKIQNRTFAPIRRLVQTLGPLNSIVQDPNITALEKRLATELLSVDVNADEAIVRKESRTKADSILAALKPLQQSWTQQQQEAPQA